MRITRRMQLLLVVSAAACGRREDAPASSRPPATAARATSGVTWRDPPCAIVPAQAVSQVLGKPVTTRDERNTHLCEYVPGTSYAVTITYHGAAGGKGEFEIFKSLEKKAQVVDGLGVAALDGSSLAVLLGDGRSFMVTGGDREQRKAIARLVLAAN